MVTKQLFDCRESLIRRVVDLLQDAFQSGEGVMLSGGQTPYAIYNRIANAPSSLHLKTRLFLSDERMTPSTSSDSNFGNLKPMLRALKAEDCFIPVKTDLPCKKAAALFATELEGIPRIALGLLGIGTDGHTAGLFSIEAARQTTSLAIPVQRADGLEGVSTTPALFAKIQKIIVIATGSSKYDIIHVLLNTPDSIPAGVALANHKNAEVWYCPGD